MSEKERTNEYIITRRPLSGGGTPHSRERRNNKLIVIYVTRSRIKNPILPISCQVWHRHPQGGTSSLL